MSNNQNRTRVNFKVFLNALAYIALVVIAFCLLLQLVLKAFDVQSSVVNAFRIVGECIAYCVVGAYGFYFVRGKKNPVWAIVYAIALTAILILVIFR